MLKTLILIGLIVMAWQCARDRNPKEKSFNFFQEIWKGLTGTEF